MSHHFLGVDVGTGSVRAGLVAHDGRILKTHSKEVTVHNPKPDFYQQSSTEIWDAVVECIRQVTVGCDVRSIKGVGFDATCSLVLVGAGGERLSIDESDANSPWDIIMWMDHRANAEAEMINKQNHPVLNFVGGSISLEMQTPKLLWIKNNLPEVWKGTEHFFDLSDFLIWKATGSLARSLCSTVCKWTYEVGLDGVVKGWNASYLSNIGLGDLVQQGYKSLGVQIVSPGTYIGTLSSSACQDFGLGPDVSVGASLIDAHAGALGMLACIPARKLAAPDRQLGLICGTSACHMALSKAAVSVPGVWGPYYSAILPSFWLTEGGQTAVGSLIDHIISSHPAYDSAMEAALSKKVSIQQYLENILDATKSRCGLKQVALLACDLHIWPDFHGNRAPLADPAMRGTICGLTLEKDEESLALVYLAAIQAVTYGTKHIVERMESYGLTIEVATICGGLSKSSIFIQTHADVLGMTVIKPKESESVLLGAAMLGAAAALRENGSLEDVLKQMEGDGEEFKPNLELRAYHEKKYKVFRAMGEDQIKYRKMMKDVA